MYILGILFLIYCFLKLFFYGIYEIKNQNNKIGGSTICILSIASFFFSNWVIIHYYI